MSLERFIELWTYPDYPPVQITAAELDAAEVALSCRLPADYRAAVLRCGVPYVPTALLNFVADEEADVADVSELVLPEEIVEMTKTWWGIGLPPGFVAFASDCMGNKFCFALDAAAEGQVGVWLFDHDDGEVERVASSFDAWIEGFCGLQG